ncbi:hypothetical protein PTKIN_Ptkin01aG0295600 [Pterospermum kingtungense]
METPKDAHPDCISIHIVGLRSCKRIRLSKSSIQVVLSEFYPFFVEASTSLGVQGPEYYSSEISKSQVNGSTSSTIAAIVQEQVDQRVKEEIQPLIPTEARVSVPSSAPPSSVEVRVDYIDPGSYDKDSSSSYPNAASFD